MRRKIRRNLFPRYTFVARAMKILRPVIEHVRVMRRGRHGRDSLEAINEIAGGIPVK